jgi:DNA polymerase III alpha subunit
MTESRKRILDAFQNHLYDSYEHFCTRHQVDPSTKGLITYLIDKDLIPSVAIKRFTITQEFDKIYPQQKKHKTKTINALSDKFNIPERTIWGILKKGD